ncbi:hypothetical protein WBP07_29710 [Novosphingobium sp. BL-8A]|uniref:hypothetical protein n=1 Tax=Novosphingobium sp. BL-8A TaxID=3127639 RepID=UPI003757EC10
MRREILSAEMLLRGRISWRQHGSDRRSGEDEPRSHRRYFEGKDAIIIVVCERRFSGFEHLLAELDKGFPTIDDRISQFSWWIDPIPAFATS